MIPYIVLIGSYSIYKVWQLKKSHQIRDLTAFLFFTLFTSAYVLFYIANPHASSFSRLVLTLLGIKF